MTDRNGFRVLDGPTLTVVDNETDTLSSVDARVPHPPEVVSHLARRKPTRQHAGHDCVTVFDHLCVPRIVGARDRPDR